MPAEVRSSADDYLAVGDRDQLERGFRRLPPEQRALLVLRHYAGLEPTEIADALGIPAGTARSRLHHAHRALRAALEADARASRSDEASA
jgi:RNA polymerase sigma-70 factor (ECF subfamily)